MTFILKKIKSTKKVTKKVDWSKKISFISLPHPTTHHRTHEWRPPSTSSFLKLRRVKMFAHNVSKASLSLSELTRPARGVVTS